VKIEGIELLNETIFALSIEIKSEQMK